MRIVIAEDSVLLREGLTRLLAEAGHQVVAGVGDADALRRAVGETSPDLAIIDVRLPPGHSDEGIRAALDLHRARPSLALLILSQYVEETFATQLLAEATERVGYLLKERVADVGEFLAAVRRVGEGGTALDPEVVAQLLARRVHGRSSGLTPREREVLALMAEGRSNAAIAARLVITGGAVEKHISSVFGKLGLSDSGTGHRRVLAVLAYLGRGPASSGRRPGSR